MLMLTSLCLKYFSLYWYINELMYKSRSLLVFKAVTDYLLALMDVHKISKAKLKLRIVTYLCLHRH